MSIIAVLFLDVDENKMKLLSMLLFVTFEHIETKWNCSNLVMMMGGDDDGWWLLMVVKVMMTTTMMIINRSMIPMAHTEDMQQQHIVISLFFISLS